MRVLWVCNQCIPVIAKHLNMEIGNKEGWLSGLSSKLLEEKENGIELAVAFPQGEDMASFKGEYEVTAYGFPDDRANPHIYDSSLEERFKEIIDDYKPDVIHIFGTEYPHTLAVCRAAGDGKRILIGIQGLCSVYAKHYFDGLDEMLIDSYTLRDRLKKDNLRKQQEKFVLRGRNEIEALKIAGNVTGRTDWDLKYTKEYNPDAEYYFMNETLRSNFYDGEWDYDKCEKHSIFVSQGDYPIKGLHLLLEALPLIKEEYEDVKVYVSGQNVTGDTLKRRVLIGSYGRHLKKLIKENGLEDSVIFLGSLSADKMKERYLKSNVFVSPSVMENSPNSLCEAMILGMPVVSGDVGGVRNLLKDKEEGLIYPALSKKELVEAVSEVFRINGTPRMKEMCEAARKHAQKTHDGDVNFARLKEIYKQIGTK